MVVALTRSNVIAIVTINNPPVNATRVDVRQGLADAFLEAEADATIKAVVLICAGRTFIAGADIKEFGKPPLAPHLPDLLAQIETASKPWIAAIHGSVLGGGLETALACSHRIATRDAKLGLPEVTLGVIPGAGGTVRLPRLIPVEKALEMIATGKPVTAEEALSTGLIDTIAAGDLLEDAIQLARQVAGETMRKPLIAGAPLPPSSMDAFEGIAAKIEAKGKGQNAPKAAIQAVRNGLSMNAADALALERKTFLKLRDDPQSAALRHIFFAERATTQIKEIKGLTPSPLTTIGVIGGGTMGSSIAAACLLAGFSVIMVERDREAVSRGLAKVANILSDSLRRGIINADEQTSMLAHFDAIDRYNGLSEADLVIEAVFEDMNIKKQVFVELNKVTRPETILATNTSYLDVGAIATMVNHPSRVIGLHFFAPAHIMKLIEIVTPEALDDQVLATSIAFARKLKKIPVISGVCDGFIANRIMSNYRREAEIMLEDGALPWDIDAAMTEFGFPMGIFAMQDLAGLDISWAMRKRQAATRDPNERYVHIGDKLCEQGYFGRKAGRGYYRYDENGTSSPCPDVEALILNESKRKGINRQPMTKGEIMARILNAMQSEAQKLLDGGIARSPDDIDVVMVGAFGFPRWRGGPMFMKNDTNRSGTNDG